MTAPTSNLTELQNTRAVKHITSSIVNQTDELNKVNILSNLKADLGQGTKHLKVPNIKGTLLS
jgi:hypothetical protein